MTIQDDAADLLGGHQVLELIAKGRTIRAAAEELGLTIAVARRLYQRQLQAAVEDNRELAGSLVHQDLETLRQLHETWMPRATGTDYESGEEDDPKGWGKDQEGAAKVMLGILDRRAKLLGLDAAIKHEVSVDKINEAVERVGNLLSSVPAAPLARLTRVPEEG